MGLKIEQSVGFPQKRPVLYRNLCQNKNYFNVREVPVRKGKIPQVQNARTGRNLTVRAGVLPEVLPINSKTILCIINKATKCYLAQLFHKIV